MFHTTASKNKTVSNGTKKTKTAKNVTPKRTSSAPRASAPKERTSAYQSAVNWIKQFKNSDTGKYFYEFQQNIMRTVLRIVAALLISIFIWMIFEGSTVRVTSVDLPLKQLPAAFNGVRILYLSDVHINSLNSVGKVNALMNELKKLEPDLLLLGGDYTTPDPFMRISAFLKGETSPRTIEAQMRDLFFLGLADFNPPLGKFAIAGEHDNLLERSSGYGLKESALLGGVTLLRDEVVRIERDGQTLVIVGTDDWTTGLQDIYTPASLVSAKECVLVLCHNPEEVLSLNKQPASDGMWMDAVFTGHTHGGGIALFGVELFNPLGDNARFRAGWHRENTTKVLISRGVGNDLLPFRLGAPPEVHLITLKTHETQ